MYEALDPDLGLPVALYRLPQLREALKKRSASHAIDLTTVAVISIIHAFMSDWLAWIL